MHGIEGLRGLAALSVLLHHVNVAPLTGEDRFGPLSRLLNVAGQGLTLFFALSGFLLFLPFAEAILSDNRSPSVAKYFRNRALRILPAYLAIFLLASYVLRTTYSSGHVTAATLDGIPPVGPVTDPVLVLANLGVVQTYVPTGIRSGIGPAWSLTVEIVFYLALPALALIAAALARRSSRLLAAVLPAVVFCVVGMVGKAVAQATLEGDSATARFLQQWGPNGHSVLERSFLVHADLFAYGMLAAVVAALVNSGRLPQRHVRRLAAVGLLAAPVALFLFKGTAVERWTDSCFGISASCLILLTVLPGRSDTTQLARVLEWAPLRSFGLISYSVYLWHVPVISWWESHGLGDQNSLAALVVRAVAVLVTTIALATLTYRFVERPALRRKRPTLPQRPLEEEAEDLRREAAP